MLLPGVEQLPVPRAGLQLLGEALLVTPAAGSQDAPQGFWIRFVGFGYQDLKP
jgi:hypothetical protein